MKVLVTGGAGFIGSHLVDRLVKDDQQVRIIDNLSSGKLDNIRAHLISGKAEFLQGDIRDANFVAKSLIDVDAVVHLAAIVSVTLSVENPDLTFDVNLSGTRNLLRLSAKEGVDRFVFASSCAVYGDPASLPTKEEAATNPISPYAKSKLEAEQACLDFSKQKLLQSVILRFFNVYGPRQANNDYSGVITRFIDRTKQKLPLVIFGDGSQTRDFVNVKDIVEGILASLTMAKAESQVFNIGTGKPTSINELAKTVSDLAGAELQISHKEPRAGEIKDSYADIAKARKILKYKPSVSLKDGLQSLMT